MSILPDKFMRLVGVRLERRAKMSRTDVHKANVGLYDFFQDIHTPVPQYEFQLGAFRDPQHKFKSVDGRSKAVQEWIIDDPRMPALLSTIEMLVFDQVKEQKAAWLSIGFRDYHGKWISAALVEIIADRLSARGFDVMVRHEWPGNEVKPGVRA